MTGKYDIEIYNKRVHYHLTVKRNITVIQGDSATGKTELLRMISDYENNGISSGITEICEKRCVVIENASWKERLATLQQCIIFIDEGALFLRSKEFTKMVKGSDNYFVLVTRDSLEHLPYSIEEIYGMRQERDSQKYQNARRIYNETYQLYNLQANEDIHPDLIITEDSNSGYEFYHKIVRRKRVAQQKGKKQHTFRICRKSHEKRNSCNCRRSRIRSRDAACNAVYKR